MNRKFVIDPDIRQLFHLITKLEGGVGFDFEGDTSVVGFEFKG